MRAGHLIISGRSVKRKDMGRSVRRINGRTEASKAKLSAHQENNEEKRSRARFDTGAGRSTNTMLYKRVSNYIYFNEYALFSIHGHLGLNKLDIGVNESVTFTISNRTLVSGCLLP